MVSEIDTWDLIRDGRFEEAVGEADRQASTTSSVLPVRNKVLALLNLGRYEDAGSLCERIIERVNGESDSDFIWLGVARWRNDDRAGAVNAWRAGEAAKFTDAAGGVEIPALLLFSGAMSGDDALIADARKRMRAVLKKATARNWPGPVGTFLLDMTDEHVLRRAVGGPPQLRQKQMCQAEFYVGVKRLLSGDLAGCRDAMTACCEQGPVSLQRPEYYLALGERR